MKKTIIIIFLVGLITFFGIKYVYKNRVKIFFKNSLNNILIIKDENIIDNYIKIKNIDSNLLKDLSFKISFSNNNIDFTMNKLNNNLLNLSILEQNNKLYLDLINIYDKLIELNLNYSKEDLAIIKESFINSLSNSIEKCDYSFNNNVYTLNINKNNKEDVINTFIDNLKRSQKFNDSIYKLNKDFDYSKTREYINNILGENIKLSIYLNDNSVSKIILDKDNKNVVIINKLDNNSYDIILGSVIINYKYRTNKNKENTINKEIVKLEDLNLLDKLEIFVNFDNKKLVNDIFTEFKTLLKIKLYNCK